MTTDFNGIPDYLLRSLRSNSRKGAIKNYVAKVKSVFSRDPVIIWDSGCDQSVLGRGWLPLNETLYTDEHCPGISPALNSKIVKMPIGSAVTTLLDLNGKPVAILRVNQAFLDPQAGKESMISEDQAALAGWLLEKRLIDRRIINKDQGKSLEAHHTGCTSFLRIRYPTKGELARLDTYELTPKEKWTPEDVLTSTCMSQLSDDHGKDHSVKSGGRHVRRGHIPNNPNSIAKAKEEWKRILCGASSEAVSKTLENTTQRAPFVEVENRSIPRMFYKSRFPFLRPKRLDGTCYTDTFEYKVGTRKTFVQFFYLVKCKHIAIYRLSGPDNVHKAYASFITDIGAPARIVADNAKNENTSKKVKDLCDKYQIKRSCTEAHHQNQNRAERYIQWLKGRADYTARETAMNKKFYWQLLEHVVYCWNMTSHRDLKWLSPNTLLTGETQDISHLRYSFWDPVWYYSPGVKSPGEKMLKGRFLGVAPNHGDNFTYHIMTIPNDRVNSTVIQRSAICLRDTEEKFFGQLLSVKERSRAFLFPRTLCPSVRGEDVEQGDDDASVFTEPLQQHTTIIPVVERAEKAMMETSSPTNNEQDTTHVFADGSTVNAGSRGGGEVGDDERDQIQSEEASYSDPRDETPTSTIATMVNPMKRNHGGIKSKSANQSNSESLSVNPPAVGRGRRRGKKRRSREAAGENTTVGKVTDQAPIEQSLKNDFTAAQLAARSSNPEYGYGTSSIEDRYGKPSIIKHQWRSGELFLLTQIPGLDEPIWASFDDCRQDCERELALYIQDKRPNTSDPTRRGSHILWAKNYLKKSERTHRRLTTFYGITDDGHDTKLVTTVKARRLNTGKKAPNRKHKQNIKFGVRIPTSTEEALRFDKENGNTFWRDAIKKEIDTLMAMNTLKFCSTPREIHDLKQNVRLDKRYQFAKMWMIFDVKSDGRRKARLVIGGHMTKPGDDIECYSSMMRQESTRILLTIAEADGYKVAVGDIENAYLNAYTSELIWTTAGLEFVSAGYVSKVGTPAIVIKAQYGLKSSGHQFWDLLSDTLRSIGFRRTLGDPDVWIRANGSKWYDYIGTHVDDLFVVGKNTDRIFSELKAQYKFKSTTEPVFHLGVDYYLLKGRNGKAAYCVGSVTYIKEALVRVEKLIGHTLIPSKFPMTAGSHPESDNTNLLDDDEHTLYMQLIGIGVWITSIGRFDIAYAISSLSRFSAKPREGHLIELKRVFAYLKRYQDRRHLIDSRDPEDKGDPIPSTGDMKKYYSESVEDIGEHPEPRGKEIKPSVWFDSNHAHDVVTRKSITGMMLFLGRTLVKHVSRRQGAIESSTYGAEFMAGRMATEELKGIRFLLRSFGKPVKAPSLLLGDNLGMLQSSKIPDGSLKKKWCAVSYHLCREAVAIGISCPRKVSTNENVSDCLTKALTGTALQQLTSSLWVKPNKLNI